MPSTCSVADWTEFNVWCFAAADMQKANRRSAKIRKTYTQEEIQTPVAPVSIVTCTSCLQNKSGPGALNETNIATFPHHTCTFVECPPITSSCTKAQNAYAQFTAGALGGCTSTYATHWLDTIKVKMQSFPQVHSNGYLCLKNTMQQEGIRGLYQGATPAVLGHTCKAAIVFMTYGLCEEMVRHLAEKKRREDLTIWHHAAAGAMTGVTASFVLCPLELIKCRMQALQVQVIPNATGMEAPCRQPLVMAREVVRLEGVRGLYRGLNGMWCKEIPGSFVYFGSYETAKSVLVQAKKTEDLSKIEVFLCGIFAGLCFCVTHPLESVKTRVQVMSAFAETKGFLRAFWQILKAEGLYSLCSGMKPQLLRACLFSGIQFMIYESTKDVLVDHYKRKNNHSE